MDKDKTLYISDLDDTLLNKNSVISEYTKDALNEMISVGINSTIATGRTTDAAERIMSGVGLNVPIASFNGAVFYDVKQKWYVKIYGLSAETVGNIIVVLKSHDIPALMYELRDETIAAYYESLEDRHIRDFIDNRKSRYGSVFRLVHDLGGIPQEHVMYFTLIGAYDRIKPVYDALKLISGINISMVDDTASAGFWWLEIFSAEASKESAVMFLRETYGFNKVVCFGDNYNDLPMFKVCDVRVAVNNALDSVKTAADHICGSNNDDGVVKWIMNHINRTKTV